MLASTFIYFDQYLQVTTGRAKSSTSMLQASNILLMGCNVVEGEGTGLVIASGNVQCIPTLFCIIVAYNIPYAAASMFYSLVQVALAISLQMVRVYALLRLANFLSVYILASRHFKSVV
jgi:hypothetical protein